MSCNSQETCTYCNSTQTSKEKKKNYIEYWEMEGVITYSL